MKNKKWFTLLEVLLSVMILSIFIGTIITVFIEIKWADWKMVNKRLLIAEASDLMDRIHEAAIEYTIDYEEYFNYKELGNTWFSSYWNDWTLYYCYDWPAQKPFSNYIVYPRNWNWCERQWKQKYLEYYFQHLKVSSPAQLNSIENSWANQWVWPIAVDPNTWLDYLYLISEDGSERYYFRRIIKSGKDINNDNYINWKNEILYTVQMLRLKWLDAWIYHDYNSRWSYDWFIDTRVCDSTQWFSCSGNVASAKDRLPLDRYDGRIDLTDEKVTVSDMKIDIYPNKDPYIATNDDDARHDPYIKISFTMNMYWIESNDEITLSSSYSFKNSYSKFPAVKYTWYICNKTECGIRN